jgi:xylulose-5-phosphate/fructose-6-phosphate phosphoketolase
MVVINDLDRFHLVMDVIDRVPKLEKIGAHIQQAMRNKIIDHKQYVSIHGEDMPEIKNWKWPY